MSPPSDVELQDPRPLDFPEPLARARRIRTGRSRRRSVGQARSGPRPRTGCGSAARMACQSAPGHARPGSGLVGGEGGSVVRCGTGEFGIVPVGQAGGTHCPNRAWMASATPGAGALSLITSRQQRSRQMPVASPYLDSSRIATMVVERPTWPALNVTISRRRPVRYGRHTTQARCRPRGPR